MSAARHYFARAPRYVFQTQDGTLVRFAPMQTKGIIARAIIRDLSETGLSFTLPVTEDVFSLPEEGSPLKVEFPIPGQPKGVACYATVMRVEQRNEWVPEWGDRGFHLIALQFRHLPTLHLKAIRRGLEGRANDENEIDFQSINRSHAFALAGLAVALLACLFAMTMTAHAWSNLFHKLF